MKEIAKITGFEGLIMYRAWYSWVTIADSIDIPGKIISKGLRYADKSLAGRMYIVFDWLKVDRANRQMIDCIMRK